jgi:saposin
MVQELLLDGIAKPELEALIGELCQSLGDPFASICTTFFDQTLDDIIALIEAGVSVLDICKKIGLCQMSAVVKGGKSHAVRRPVLHQIPKDVICDLCQEAVQYVEVLVLNDTLKPDIEDLINQWCQTLPYPISALCQSYADAWIDDIIEWIEEGIQSFDICAKLGLCASASQRRARKAIFYHSVSGPRSVSDKNDVFCGVCQQIVQYIEQLVLDNFAKAEIEALVAELCGTLPSPLSALCQSWIDGYIDDIIADIEAGIAAFDICGKIGLCGSRSGVVPHRSATQARLKKMTGPNGLACDICQDILQVIEKGLIDGLAKEAIEVLVAGFCDTLPFPVSSLCNSFIDGYIDDIFAWIDAGITGLDICQKLGLCSSASKKRAVRRPVQKAKVGGEVCDMCQETVQYIEQLLVDGFVKQDIDVLVAELCRALPAPLSALYTSWIDGYVDEIIADIGADIDALDICGKLRLCSARHKPIRKALRPRRPILRRPPGDILCDLCQEAIAYIEKAILNDTVEVALDELVNEACSGLPYPLSAICISTLDAYIDDIIVWIEQEIDHLQICQSIGFCTTPTSIKMRKMQLARARPVARRKFHK